MSRVDIGDWYRTCQECGNEQRAKEPPKNKELSNSYLNSKCKACGSASLDYGTFKTADEDWTQ